MPAHIPFMYLVAHSSAYLPFCLAAAAGYFGRRRRHLWRWGGGRRDTRQREPRAGFAVCPHQLLCSAGKWQKVEAYSADMHTTAGKCTEHAAPQSGRCRRAWPLGRGLLWHWSRTLPCGPMPRARAASLVPRSLPLAPAVTTAMAASPWSISGHLSHPGGSPAAQG